MNFYIMANRECSNIAVFQDYNDGHHHHDHIHVGATPQYEISSIS